MRPPDGSSQQPSEALSWGTRTGFQGPWATLSLVEYGTDDLSHSVLWKLADLPSAPDSAVQQLCSARPLTASPQGHPSHRANLGTEGSHDALCSPDSGSAQGQKQMRFNCRPKQRPTQQPLPASWEIPMWRHLHSGFGSLSEKGPSAKTTHTQLPT